MRLRPSRLTDVLSSPEGRLRLATQIAREAWPVSSRLAAVYRRIAMKRCVVCTVIGSLGKSTTTRAVRAALGLRPGSARWGNAWGGMIVSMLRRPGSRGPHVIEVGIQDVGEMADYARVLRPDMAVVTCVASEHHRSLGTLEVTRREKSEMLRVLPAGGLAVLNGDDPNVLWMARRTRARTVTCGFGPDNDLQAADYRLEWPRGSSFTVRADGWTERARMRLIGRQMVFPVLAGIAIARELGIPPDAAIHRLEDLLPTPGRMQPVALPNGAWVLRDDYKSTYETIRAALDTFEQVPARRRFVVLGDVSEPPGSQGPIYRGIGRRVAGMAERLYVVGRSHQRYAAGAVRAGMPRDAVVKARFDLPSIARDLQKRMRRGDVVLVKGRDNQQLERVALSLQGVKVECRAERCPTGAVQCEECPRLNGRTRPNAGRTAPARAKSGQ